MDGIVNFLKPASMTSHDAVSFFRRLTGIRKIGHTGTLDPMAVGVLPICIGRATRLIEYLEDDKAYRAVMKLGLTGETGDIWGDELRTVDYDEVPSEDEIEKVFRSFEGRITQNVPGFSAQKYNGRKLYEYARAGEEIPVKKKQVFINSITVNKIDSEKNEILFDIDCSKGTYVRTICTDAGERLGTGGVMSFLLRTKASGLQIEDSVTIEELEEEKKQNGNIEKYLKCPDVLLVSMEKIILNSSEAGKFVNGLSIDTEITEGTEYAVFMETAAGSTKLLGIGKGNNNRLKPQKVIFSEQ